MRQVTRKGLMTMAAATGVLAAAGGVAHADSGATGAATGSPGVLSGNSVQAPVHVPVNVCGNTVNVVGALNPSVGNACVNQGGSSSDGHGDSGDRDGAHAGGHAAGSPGVASGNHVQAPIHVPVNVCGNSVNVLGVGNATAGNECANGGSGHETPGQPGVPDTPAGPGSPERPGDEPGTPGDRTPDDSREGNEPVAHSVTQPRADAQLARTGSELPMGLVLPVGAGALLAGAVLYRKARAAA
ncbi:Chaplin-C [Streptomyces sp. enrichment culture]|uniref:chaplin n=1 Tax=Streptomyces sp. enrichment culture TaxID=1795815 RepID=UPI003F55E070